jgi:Ca2+/H+ antiporter, TMEM165/GDT1 family
MKRYFLFPPLFIGLVFLAAAIVMYLWNAIMPSLLNVGTLGYWQALGLLVLTRILFGGFHHRGHHHRPHFLHHRWSQLSEEEREKMREEWHNRCWCGSKSTPPASPESR